MMTTPHAFAGLLPVAVLSLASPLIMQPVIAMQVSRNAPLTASKSVPSRTSKPPVLLSPEARYRQSQTFDLFARSSRGGMSASADAGSTTQAQTAYSTDPGAPFDPETAELGIYGPGIGGDALGNNLVGGPVSPKKWFIRFRAEQSSALVSVTIPFLSADYPGYGAGTGGEWKLTLHADDGSNGHFPTGTPLATRTQSASATSNAARTITFVPPYATTAGTLYHLVFENTDPDPTANYFSINNWVRLSFTEGGQLNPRYSDTDWGSGYFHAGTWSNHKATCPIADIAYANGAHQGMCYGEASYACPPGQEPCTPEGLVGQIDEQTNWVRERFTVSGGNKAVYGVGIRLLRSSDTTGDLIVSLRNGMDEEIASTTIPASAVASGPAPRYVYPASFDDVGQNARWVTAEFDGVQTLEEGETYSLQFSSAQGTYWAWVIRRLTPDYAYSPATVFTDGWAEYTTDGSSWSPLGRVPQQNDLQFYLSTVETSDDPVDEDPFAPELQAPQDGPLSQGARSKRQ